MKDCIFAFIFTIVIIYILPDVPLTRLETIMAYGFIYVVGLYVYSEIEHFKERRNLI